MYVKLTYEDHTGHEQWAKDQQRAETKSGQKGRATFKAGWPAAVLSTTVSLSLKLPEPLRFFCAAAVFVLHGK